MTVRADGEDLRTGTDLSQPPGKPELQGAQEVYDDRELDVVEGDEAIEGEDPIFEAKDTSGVSQTPVFGAKPQELVEADPLFGRDLAEDFRSRWDAIQRGFVDDPQKSVRDGDDLVTQVIDELRQTFAAQRSEFETGGAPEATENLRLALRRYRSFFERLLTI